MTATNCIVCAKEFDANSLKTLIATKVNNTKFKICDTCLNNSNPDDDFKQAREIIGLYLKFAQAKK